MESDMFMFAVDGETSVQMEPKSFADVGILETSHLERWVVDHPEVLGDNVKIVTTQYDKWSSDFGDLAKERLDILGLDSSGQLVVVELKRGTDSRIHLQAITYAALVAGFSKETLADAHSEYLNRTQTSETPVTALEARAMLDEHVEGEWEDEILTLPKIILLAEEFAAQTYTTVKWLSDLTTNLTIEMHTANVFVLPGSPSNQRCLVFRRLFPVIDPASRVLTPGIAATSVDSVSTRIAERKRRNRSTYILYDHNVIPEGVQLDLHLQSFIGPDLVHEVERWVEVEPERGQAIWTRHRERPLKWGAEPHKPLYQQWTPTGLAVYIIKQATGETLDAIAGPDVWRYAGQPLSAMAKQAENNAT